MKVSVSKLLAHTAVIFEHIYEGQYKSNASCFFSETIITVIMKFTYIMGASITKLRLFFHTVFFIINTLFPPMRETLYDHCVKLFAEALEHFTHAVFQLVVICKMASSECVLHGAKKTDVRGC
jgi:hypothetical protein